MEKKSSNNSDGYLPRKDVRSTPPPPTHNDMVKMRGRRREQDACSFDGAHEVSRMEMVYGKRHSNNSRGDYIYICIPRKVVLPPPQFPPTNNEILKTEKKGEYKKRTLLAYGTVAHTKSSICVVERVSE